MRVLTVTAFVLLSLAVALAQSPAPAAPKTIPSFDINALDKSVDPCVDFYKFSCGGWMASNPIPADKSRWGRFNELRERNLAILRDILEKAAPNSPKRSELDQKIGDHYASCMDEKAIEALGAKPLQPELARIAAIKTRTDLIDTLSHLYTLGAPAVFSFYPTADLHNAQMVIANVDQGGISLPDRDYYIKDDAKSTETRTKYAEHVQKMFELMGDKPETASAEAKTVLAVETALAQASMDRTQRRDPKNRDHKMTVAELAKQAPGFEFTRFFTRTAAPKFESLNVGNPEFFKQINAQLEAVPLADWKTYLRWRTVHAVVSVLPKAFVDEDFRFYGQYLRGTKEIEARWKRCSQAVDRDLGELLGQPYVDQAFGAEGRQRTLQMVEAIEKAMEQDIRGLDWMTEATKKRALEKLAAIRNKIGYPEKWRDYSKLKIVRGDAIGNAERANSFEFARQINKVGKPIDKKEWGMTPPTVNAYYSAALNDINFPAGILQPPFFDKNIDDPVNYGGIGVVIGHELTHGFDDQGRKFDPQGNLTDWWTADDGREFEKRAACIENEYSGFVAVADVHLKGKLTLGENTADNGGARISFVALQNTLAGKPQKPLDGFTPEQRFFLGFAQIWCENVTDEQAGVLALTDPHSPGRYRVNGTVQNMPEFQKAFGCKPGQPMVAANACRVW